MKLGQLPGDEQTETTPSILSMGTWRRLREALEEDLLLINIESTAGVLDLEM
jgi:hypothetical protein